MEFERHGTKGLWKLLKIRRYRRLALALLLPILLLFKIYAPERYEAYFEGTVFVPGGLYTVLKGEAVVHVVGSEETVEGRFATGIVVLSLCVEVSVLVCAL